MERIAGQIHIGPIRIAPEKMLFVTDRVIDANTALVLISAGADVPSPVVDRPGARHIRKCPE